MKLIENIIISTYRFVFARSCFEFFNKMLLRLSLVGLGVLNFGSSRVSGEGFFLNNYLSKIGSGLVLDVGANKGDYTLEVMSVNEGLKIYAFEPHPKTFLKLKQNISNYHNVQCVNKAIGHEQGFLELFDYKNNDGSTHASLLKGVIEEIHQAEPISHNVEVQTIDNFLQQHKIMCVDLLKIDTEGNELNVLQGAAQSIKQGKIKVIHFEFNQMNVISRTFFKDFWDILKGYDIYRLLPHGRLEVDRYSPILCEIFAYQNIVAFLKE